MASPPRRLALVAVVLLLSACTGTSTLAADEAVGHYDTVGEDLTDALATGSPGTTWTLTAATRTVAGDGGTCTFTPGTWEPSAALEAPGDDDAWQQRIDALNPVLEDAGFEMIDGPTAQGSREVLSSRDGHGATMTLTPEGQLRIHGARVDADPCTPQALGLS